MKQSALCRRIAQTPGIGPITATAIVAAVGDARQFRNGRHLAAWLGIVPRQYSSGGKSRLCHISRRRDT
jgi:transposase